MMSARSSKLIFWALFFKNKEKIKITLFSVAPKSYAEGIDENGGASEPKVPGANVNRDKWQNAIHLKREILVRLGFLDDHITGKVISSRYGTIEDIIVEGKKGPYDAVILARHTVELLDQTIGDNKQR